MDNRDEELLIQREQARLGIPLVGIGWLGQTISRLLIKYVDFLSAWNAEEAVDFSIVEDFWAEQVREYFRNQPFILTADTTKTIGANLDDLFEQAKKRQK